MNGSGREEGGATPVEITIKGKADLKNLFSLAKTPLFSDEIRSKTEWIEELSGTTEFFSRARVNLASNFLPMKGKSPLEDSSSSKGSLFPHL
jgi:hypothetical protein